METRRVGEIMIPLADYPHLPVWSTILEAVQVMRKASLDVRGRKSLPRIVLLFDLDGSIAGTARRRDLMRGLEPSFLVAQPLEYRRKLFDVEVDPNLSELSFDRVVKGIREQAHRPVTDVMRPIEQTIRFDDHVMKAVNEMVTYSLSILPVVRGEKVVGVIRTVDVFDELAELLPQ
jgi:CBS domain-containing protein